MDIFEALKELKKGNKLISGEVLYSYDKERNEIMCGRTLSVINRMNVAECLLDQSKFELYEEPIVLKAGDKYSDSNDILELVSNKEGTLWGLFYKTFVPVNFISTEKMQNHLKNHPRYKKVS